CALFVFALAGLWSGDLAAGSFREGRVRAVSARWLVPGGGGATQPETAGDRPMKRFRKTGAWVAVATVPLALQAMAQQAVEWKVSESGNGHWYAGFARGSITPEAAEAEATSMGGSLVSLETLAEGEWVFQNVSSRPELWTYTSQWALGPWIGLRRSQSGWVWQSGAPLTDASWLPGEPNGPASNMFVHYYDDNRASPGTREIRNAWNDNLSTDIISSFVVEWSADCNGDGKIDYGQILNSELVDSNGNGIPDCCDDGTVCAPGLMVNFSFESGSPLNTCASESVSSGNLVASGWQVTDGVVDRIRGGATCATSTQPKLGNYCVDLCGTPASSGAIKQMVPTVPGHKYRCTFWLSGDASAGPATKKVHAKVGTYIDLSFTFACTGSGAQSWVSNQFEFTARGANEPLEFVADNGVTTGGPMLDAINLVDITTQCVGDLDDSGDVDGADISLLLLNFGQCPAGS
ncbi:MAG: DUF642 domain-containing protein, partial [Planctomycetota bacterium]